jgi:hypothetical protein
MGIDYPFLSIAWVRIDSGVATTAVKQVVPFASRYLVSLAYKDNGSSHKNVRQLAAMGNDLWPFVFGLYI